ncbi:MAG TPA: Fe-S cluster assembly protein SufD [Thermoanaerobaculia bacterium]|nr:Fe-S cluster assembly protein SufD [Thermoanaerobaculia bacterium]
METLTATPTIPETPVQAAEATAPYLADFEAFQRELSTPETAEPAGLQALRRQAIDAFARLGFPTLRQEEWRSTNVAAIARTPFTRMTGEPADLPAAALEPLIFDAAVRLVFVDGRFAPRLSTLSTELPQGAFIGSLAEALARAPQLVEPHLARYARFDHHPFVALNTAFLRDGAFVYLPRGAVLEKPVHLLFMASGSEGAATVNYPRNLIVAGENSQMALVETYAGLGTYFTCAVTELVSGPGAVVDHYKVQRESVDAYHIATFQIEAERACAPSSHSISIGGAIVRNDVNAVLDGEGIDCILNGLYLAEGRQLIDNHMRVEHAKPHCGSHELYKGILDGKARAVFNGLIHVRHGAQKTDAKQSNRNLLLSPDAIANSNPQLEIFADDVKCTHGSTVGQLDEDAVFYLRSRGIGKEAARSLLTYAFASDIVERIKVEPVRRDLEEFLFARLPQGGVVRQAV